MPAAGGGQQQGNQRVWEFQQAAGAPWMEAVPACPPTGGANGAWSHWR